MKRILQLLALVCLPAIAFAQGGNLGSNSSPVTNRLGLPIPGTNIAICQPLATTAASVTSNLAVLTMTSNPITAGFVAGMQIQVSGFSGGDAYFNGGTFTNGTGITSGFTILSVTSTTITYSLTHANASAGTNGTVLQQGNSTTSCAGLSAITSDPNLLNTLTQPITADGLGNWNAFAAPGVYYAQFYGAGITTKLNQYATACVPSATTGTCGAALNGNNAWTGNETHSGTETFTGTINCTIFNGARCLNPTNTQLWTGATADAWMASAISSIGSSGGELYLSSGAYAPVAQVVISTPVWLHGAGINNTTIKPTAALASALFSITTGSEGIKVSDLTIDMTNAPTMGTFNLNGTVHPIFENVRIIYPVTGTGTALALTAVNEMHANNIIIKGAGICADVQGDGGAEHFWNLIVCESPGSYGYRLQRTTAADIGGNYLNFFKITNPANRTGSVGFLITSTAANTVEPFFCTQCIADNMQGGHSAQFINVQQIWIDPTSWFRNTAAAGSNFSAIYLSGVTDWYMDGGSVASNSRDVTFAGTEIRTPFNNVTFLGTNTNFYAAGATIQQTRFSNATFNSLTPMSNSDASLLMAAAATSNPDLPISTGGGEIWTAYNQGCNQGLSVVDKTGTPSGPRKTLLVGGNSDFQIKNNACSNLLDIPDAANDSFPGNMFISGTPPTIASGFGTSPTITNANGTVAFRITVGSAPGSTGTVNMPTAVNGWACTITDVTNPSAALTRQNGFSNNSVAVTNYNTSGVGTAWTASDNLLFQCSGI